jgi:hypothetical protein
LFTKKMKYIIPGGHSLGYLLTEAAPIDIAFNPW